MTVIKGGFAGNILHIDLTTGDIRTKSLDFRLAEKYVGGFGLTVKLAYDTITPGTEPLSPENPIVLGSGPFVGTNLPSTSRVYAVTKLPASRTIGWCGAGGMTFGYNLKHAGYDHVVIRGRADRPTYVKIIDDRIELCDASSLWGKGVKETAEALWGEFGWPAGVLCIGQAGENLIPFSMAYIDRMSTMGRGGFGAVMGSKNLKAIMVKGSRGINVADRKRYRILSNNFLSEIREYPYLKEWQELGLVKSFSHFPKETYKLIKKRRVACVSCPIGCKDVVQIQDGELKGFVASSSSAMNLVTPVIYGFKDYREAIRFIAKLDEYGLDMFEFFGLMNLAKNMVEQGLISQDQVETDIILDSFQSMEHWAEKTTFRKGLGEIIAKGFRGIFETIGEASRSLAPPLVKGMHPYTGPGAAVSWDLFGTMELGQVLDPRGPHIGASGSPTFFARRPLNVFPRHLKRMGVPEEAIERIIPGANAADQKMGLKVGRLLKYSHRWFSILASMGICARAQINRFYNALLCAELYEAVTGIATDLEALRHRVDRGWTLLRMANAREGIARNEDILPVNWFKTPGFKDYLTEEPLTIQESEQMIEDYYDEQGWDIKTGIPTKATLEQLELTECL